MQLIKKINTASKYNLPLHNEKYYYFFIADYFICKC